MGYRTASARRSTATSAVSSSVAVSNNPGGTGFTLSGLSATAQISQVSSTGTTTPVSGSGGGVTITAFFVTDSGYTNLDDTAVNTSGGYIKLIGTGFATGCTVYVNGVVATSTTYVSATEVRAQVGALTAGTYSLMMFNTTGSGAIWASGLLYSGFPTITTSAYATIGNVISTQLIGAGDGTLSYSLQGGSSLPAGVTLSSNGLISGTASSITTATILTFTVLVDDTQLQTTQQAITLSLSFSDSNFPSTILLIGGDGVSNNTNNNVFLDSSTNAATVTRNGTPTQGTFTPFSPTGWSNYFNGTSQYLSVVANTALKMGTGDFTIEAWVYRITSGAYQCICIDGNGSGLNFRIKDTNKLQVSHDGVVDLVESTTDIPTSQWTHVAVSRSGTTLRIFIDGALAGTVTGNSTNFSGSTGDFWIGARSGPQHWMNGYISNLRVVKGTAVYTAAFTPSTLPLTAITNTSLLACQTYRFKDNSTNNFAITAVGSPSVQAYSPFSPGVVYAPATHGGSGYFNNSTDYLSVPAATPVNLSSGDFTIECWFFTNNIAQASAQTLIWFGGNTSAYATVRLGLDTSGIILYVSVDGTTWAINSGIIGTVASNTWNHVAVTRSTSTFKVYLNGVQIGTNYTQAGTLYSSGTLNYVGALNYAAVVSNPYRQMNGYISDVCITKGSVNYTTTFTPPTAPLTAIANTTLLCNFTNAGVRDAAEKHLITTVGSAKVSTAVSKYGTGSVSFNGSTDYLVIPSSPLLALDTSSFTIECWAYFNAVNITQNVIRGTTQYSFAIQATNTTLYLYVSSNGTTWDVVNGANIGTISAGSWKHIAVTRSGSSFKTFLDGVAGGTGTSASSLTAMSGMYIGAESTGPGASPMNGYIDDLRVTRGVARYTANFTPPTLAMVGM